MAAEFGPNEGKKVIILPGFDTIKIMSLTEG